MKDMRLLRKSGGRCWYCGCILDVDTNDQPDSFCAEHIIPKFYGGSSKRSNIVPACRSCNSMKRTKTLEQFRTRMMLEVNNIPYFNEEQMNWLWNNGFKFSEYPKYEFYFEKMRLHP